MLAAILTTVLFSISAVCGTQSARLMGGTEANFWRLALAAAFLALWAHTLGQGLSGISFPWFLLSGSSGVGADVFLFQALPRIGSRLSLLIIQCFSALSAAALEWLWLGTKLTGSQMAACAIILAGVAVALAPGRHLNIQRGVLAAGICHGLLAAFGNGFGAVLSRKAYAVAATVGQGIDGATAAYQRLIGGLFVAGVCLLIVKRREISSHWGASSPVPPAPDKWRRAWLWILLNGFFGQTLGVSCYQWALRTMPTGIVLAIVATTPLVVIPFAQRFEGEPFHRRSLLGGIIAVAGAAFLALVR